MVGDRDGRLGEGRLGDGINERRSECRERGGSSGPERGGGARERSRRRTRTLSGVLRHTHHTSGYPHGRLTSPPSSPYPPPYAHSHHHHHQRHHASPHSHSHPHSHSTSHSNHYSNACKEDSEHGTLALDPSEEFQVDAIFSAHSDGIIVIVRRAPSV